MTALASVSGLQGTSEFRNRQQPTPCGVGVGFGGLDRSTLRRRCAFHRSPADHARAARSAAERLRSVSRAASQQLMPSINKSGGSTARRERISAAGSTIATRCTNSLTVIWLNGCGATAISSSRRRNSALADATHPNMSATADADRAHRGSLPRRHAHPSDPIANSPPTRSGNGQTRTPENLSSSRWQATPSPEDDEAYPWTARSEFHPRPTNLRPETGGGRPRYEIKRTGCSRIADHLSTKIVKNQAGQCPATLAVRTGMGGPTIDRAQVSLANNLKNGLAGLEQVTHPSHAEVIVGRHAWPAIVAVIEVTLTEEPAMVAGGRRRHVSRTPGQRARLS